MVCMHQNTIPPPAKLHHKTHLALIAPLGWIIWAVLRCSVTYQWTQQPIQMQIETALKWGPPTWLPVDRRHRWVMFEVALTWFGWWACSFGVGEARRFTHFTHVILFRYRTWPFMSDYVSKKIVSRDLAQVNFLQPTPISSALLFSIRGYVNTTWYSFFWDPSLKLAMARA